MTTLDHPADDLLRQMTLTDLSNTIRDGDTVKVVLADGTVEGIARRGFRHGITVCGISVRDPFGTYVSSNILGIAIQVTPEPPLGSVVECDGCGARFHRMDHDSLANQTWLGEDGPWTTWQNLSSHDYDCGKYVVVWTPS